MSPESLSVKKNKAVSGQSLCITLSNVARFCGSDIGKMRNGKSILSHSAQMLSITLMLDL